MSLCCIYFKKIFVYVWVFIAACLSLVVARGLLAAVTSRFGARAVVLVGFSSCSPWALEQRFRGCGARA